MIVVRVQVRRASRITAAKARENMKVSEKSLFDKIPDLPIGRVPNTDLFYNEGRGLGPSHDKGSGKELRPDTRMNYRRLAAVPHGTWDDRPMATRSFEKMNLDRRVMTALKELEVEVPAIIQQTAIPVALEGKSVAMCAPTGMGKTLAFMTPVFHRMLKDRDSGVELRPNRPRTVILAPTFELVHQLWSVANKFAQSCDMQAREYYGALSKNQAKDEYTGLYDVMVTTPTGLRRMRDDGIFVDTDLKYVVFDEADVVIGGTEHSEARMADSETFMDNLKPLLLKQFERDSYLGRHKIQFLLSSCSLTPAYTNRLEQWIPHYHSVNHQDSHTVPANISHRFYHINKKDRVPYLISLLNIMGVRRDRRWEETVEKSKKNFWFPDAITFETGMWSPSDQGSHVLPARPGDSEMPPPNIKKLLPKTFRRTYKKSYPETERLALTEPASSLLPMTVEDGVAVVDKDIMIRDARENSGNMLAPTVPRPAVSWGAERTVAAPFTGVPGVLPQRYIPKGARTIIFVDRVADVKRLARTLTAEGYHIATFYGMQDTGGHGARISEFEKWASGECSVLLTTDLAARGLDHYVNCVINYNLPAFPVDYVNRAGRTGRMGRHGMVHSLVLKNTNEKKYALNLESRLVKRKPLDKIYAHPEAFRTDLNKFWKKRQKKLVDKWNKLSMLGFATEREERKIKHETINAAFRIMPNPRGTMGRQSKRMVPNKIMHARQQHLSWQFHISGRNGMKIRGNPAKLMREGPSQFRHIAGSKDDIRRSYLYKPQTREKKEFLRKRMGRWAIPTPLNTQFVKGMPAYTTKSKYPSA